MILACGLLGQSFFRQKHEDRNAIYWRSGLAQRRKTKIEGKSCAQAALTDSESVSSTANSYSGVR